MTDEQYYVIQDGIFFKNNLDIHLVRKGMFLAQNETQMEDVLLTFCKRYVYDDDPDIPGTANEWLENWFNLGGCEECYAEYEETVKGVKHND